MYVFMYVVYAITFKKSEVFDNVCGSPKIMLE